MAGRCLGQTDGGLRFVFRPRKLRLLAWTGTDVPIGSGQTACLDCGLLWSSIDKLALAEVIARKGGKALQESLAAGS